ncbi:MAG: hypothetical protein BGO70_18325 [Bacteroidetes bacterium 43-93]|nr:hypothetical protein [Bacteroidota bacterium]OJX01688.1 MAG: hypothetical protein BGO70_18325 [Bacteroidetes bacterium 43-93]
MNRKWVMSLAAVAIIIMGALSASAQRGGFYVNGPGGSVSVNVGGGGGCYGGHYARGYQRGYYARPHCNSGYYGYNYAPPPPPVYYAPPAPVCPPPRAYYRGWHRPARVFAYGGGYRHEGGYGRGGYGHGGGWGYGHGGGHRR